MLLNAITHRPATTQLLYVIPHRTATTRGWMSVRTRRGLIAITCAVTAAKDTRLQGTALLRRSWLQLNLQLWPPPPPPIVFQLQVIVLPKRGVASEPERTVTIDSVKRTTTVRELKLMIKNKTGIHAGHFRLCSGRHVLDGDRTVASYGIAKDDRLHMLARLRGGGANLQLYGGRVEADGPITCAGKCKQTYDQGVLCQPFRNTQYPAATSEGWAYQCDGCATKAGIPNHYATNPDPWPPHWDGIPNGGTMVALYPFPCIAPACKARKVWHDRGTKCQAFCDERIGSTSRHQRTCHIHAPSGGGWNATDRYSVQLTATSSSAAGSASSASSSAADVDGFSSVLGPAPSAETEAPDCGADESCNDLDKVDEIAQMNEAEAELPAKSSSTAAKHSKTDKHDHEEGLAMGMWRAIAHMVLRVQDNGTLAFPRQTVSKGATRRPEPNIDGEYWRTLDEM